MWCMVSGRRLCVFVAMVVVAAAPARAGKADVVGVTVTKAADGTFTFDVMVKHADTGWKHYANKWEVVGPDDRVLGRRVLFHPHEDEQPFTRSLSGVKIPAGISEVTIRAFDSKHDGGGKTMTVKLPSKR